MVRRLTAVLAAAFMAIASTPGTALAEAPPRLDVLIRFAGPPSVADLGAVSARGGQITRQFRIVPAVAASLPATAVEALRAHPRVLVVEPDGLLHALEYRASHDWGIGHIGADQVHGSGHTGAGTRVAVIDSGIDCEHVELAANCDHGWNYVSNSANADDDYGHGTHVAGTVAAALHGTIDGVVGVAPSTTVVAYKTLDSGGVGSWSRHIAAIEDIWNGGEPTADVVNMSIGRGDYSSVAEEAMRVAYASGVLLVAAAGNSGTCGGKGSNVSYPALFESVIAVAAVDSANARPCWSSTGSQVELAAPGVSVFSTWPADMASSYRDPQPICQDLDANASDETCYYKYGSGTSMSAPHVAGVAALLIGAGVTEDGDASHGIANEVRQRLAETAVDLGKTGRDTLYGHGLVDAAAALAVGGDDGGGDGGSEMSPLQLHATAGKVRGQASVTLNWTDANSTPPPTVDVYRNGAVLVAGSANDGEYSDALGRARGTFTYRVCHAGTQTCSNEASVSL